MAQLKVRQDRGLVGLKKNQRETLRTLGLKRIGDVVVRSVERLAGSEDGAHNCLVVGGAGCGKSRMLDTIAALLEIPDFGALHSRLAEARASVESRSIRSISFSRLPAL